MINPMATATRRGRARWRRLQAVLLGPLLAAACDYPFQPFQSTENVGFSMLGVLDVHADTQWIRVMPVRQSSLLGPGPIDAVVTLEHVKSGKVVTLRDSVFSFADDETAVGYVHNFWVAERLEPLATYRLKALRSDGIATTALVTMPDELVLTLENDAGTAGGVNAGVLNVRAENVLFVDVLYLDSSGVSSQVRPQLKGPRIGTMNSFRVQAFPIDTALVGREELRVTAAPPDWPFRPELSDLAVSLQGRVPSNVTNGYGFVGGLAMRTIPYHRCEVLVPRPAGGRSCRFTYDAESASIRGRVIRQPCGTPHPMQDILLIERFAAGGAAIRQWKTGPSGDYRFEGIEPGADLTLEVRPWKPGAPGQQPGAPSMRLPRLGRGQSYIVGDFAVLEGCGGKGS